MKKSTIFAYIFYTYENADGKKSHPVLSICKALGVSERGYYKWKQNRNKPKRWQLLLAEIHKIIEEDYYNDNYGVVRMVSALKQRGNPKSYATVRNAMKKGNLLHESRRSPDGLTKADKKAQRPENLVKRNFYASEPDTLYFTDITEVPCADGKLYICPMFDACGGEIVSLAMDSNMKKELCIRALTEAFEMRQPGAGVIVHSDAGSQFTSIAYKQTLGKFKAIQSMSDVGKCYDNARMESFFATLKKELLYRIDTTKMMREQVKTLVWQYTMVYYNRKRINTVNEDGLPPTLYRLKVTKKKNGVA